MQETEIIGCPACQHLVRVPGDWLGTEVQCPECKARFRAPVREPGGLTDAVLLERGTAAPDAPAKRPDALLLIPAFGLLLCGVAGGLVNAFILFVLFGDAAQARDWAGKQVAALRQMGMGEGDTPEEQAAKDDERTTGILRQLKVVIPVAFVVSALVFWGGVSMVRRKHYRFAQVACVLACLNVAHLCCVPGAVAGIWGLLMLGSAEAREHFGR
jgi:hypothetical protein